MSVKYNKKCVNEIFNWNFIDKVRCCYDEFFDSLFAKDFTLQFEQWHRIIAFWSEKYQKLQIESWDIETT